MQYYTVALPKSKTKPSKRAAAPPAWDESATGVPKRVADGVSEAACLFAILSLPLYFSALTSGYEADKAVLLRVLACVAAPAWILGTVVSSRGKVRLRPEPLLLLGLSIFLAFCLATLLSIDASQSLWGSHGRQQGLWTQASYLVIFVVAATRLRSSVQLQRLVSVLLLGSLPVVIYGVFQEFGLDPVRTSGSPDTLQWPVWSTFGQHVFFGSYLVLLIPFTAARLVKTWDVWSQASPGWVQQSEVLRSAAVVLAMAVSFFAFLNLGVRHASLFAVFPLLLAIYLLAALYLLSLPKTAALRRAECAGYVALLMLQLVVLAYTGARASWLGVLFSIPVFAFLMARRLHRPQIARTILGVTAAGALCLVLLNIPNGPLQPLRTVHGLTRVANITDSGGAEGSAQGRLLIWQGVGKLMSETPSIGDTWGGAGRLLVGYGPESMALAFEKVFPLKLRQVNSEINVWDRAHNIYLDYLIDAGLIGLGLVVALLAYFFWQVIRVLPRLDDHRAWVLIPLAAAMAGHLVDGFFGVETASTLMLFWLFVGMLAGMKQRKGSEVELPAPATVPARSGLVTFGFLAALACLLLITASGKPAFLAAIWAGAVVGGLGAVTLALVGNISLARFALSSPKRSFVIGSVVVLAALLALGSQIRFETAAIADSLGLSALSQNQTSRALGLLQEAVRYNGYDPFYETHLAEPYFYLGGSRGASSEPSYVPSGSDAKTIDPQRATTLGRDQLFQLDQFALDSAKSLAPLDPDTYNNLGELYLQWNKPAQALTAYRQAEALSPKNPRYLDDEALASLTEKRNTTALSQARAALSLDTTFWLSHFTMCVVDHQLGAKKDARMEAALALYWVRNYWPPPPAQQISLLQNLQKNG